MNTTASIDDVYKIIYADHHDPFSVLGMHIIHTTEAPRIVTRCFIPRASEAWVVDESSTGNREYRMDMVHEEGFFEVVLPDRSSVFPYSIRCRTRSGSVDEFRDSYSFLPTLSEVDVYLFNKGDHHRIYEKLGSHRVTVNAVDGVQFAVWAPDARSVSVIGDFNGWDRRAHQMRILGASGIWEIFIPGIGEGVHYKFQVKTRDGFIMDKTDPYGFEMELRPRTASKVNFLSGYEWGDVPWMEGRKVRNTPNAPISIYEVHLGSWQKPPDGWYNYRELAHRLVEHVKDLGFTHIELMPVAEHPYDASWGYQVTGYFAPTSRYGTPADFMYFVDYCHQHEIGVLLDWVPAHFPKDIHALALFDGTHVYEHADPRIGEHQDWGTYIFNYGRFEVRNFLISNALFWLEKYHIDGIRIDAVASMLYLDYSRKEGQWIPNRYGGRENLEAVDFLKQLNSVVHHYHHDVLVIAEESTAWPGVTSRVENGGLGFDLKWNMGWMHDMLEYFSKDPIYRPYHHRNLTFVMMYAFSEKFLLPLSHDEVVHGKKSLLGRMPGDYAQQFANLRLLYGLMIAFPGKKLLFMGGEIGQWMEWNFQTSLDWSLLRFDLHKGIQGWVRDLHAVYRSEPALHEVDFSYEGFEWIDFNDVASSIISFERRGRKADEVVVVVCNFTPVTRPGYRVGVREAGSYRELLNSDSSAYGGTNAGNYGKAVSEDVPHNGRPYSLSVTLPSLGCLFLKREIPMPSELKEAKPRKRRRTP